MEKSLESAKTFLIEEEPREGILPGGPSLLPTAVTNPSQKNEAPARRTTDGRIIGKISVRRI